MPEWIGRVVGLMHQYKISQSELAEHIGIRRDYLNKILNGITLPKKAEMRITLAVNEIIAKRAEG